MSLAIILFVSAELEVSPKISSGGNEERSNSVIRTHPNDVRKSVINTAERSKKFKHKEKEKEENQVSLRNIEDTQVPTPEMGRAQRSPSVMKAAEVAHIPHVPIILFIGMLICYLSFETIRMHMYVLIL
ncbi:hypothetical protein NECAME_07100 [Necator americanus]|uniref:Uncharacterized protein n=1 Tax=Necator americanus TaxID=51031 RepID=W2TQQ0_NECAM|nr:hypothetical protein NECAME_07100 [Necator americanus]ETN84004.1 hypothetical protein NECAME_07100 [Necator americanus]